MEDPKNQKLSGTEDKKDPGKPEKEDELPDLNDKGVQTVTMAMQKAFWKKKKGTQESQTPANSETKTEGGTIANNSTNQEVAK